MTFFVLGACLALLAHGAASCAASLLVSPLLRIAGSPCDPLKRARRLLALRLLPSALGALSAGLVLAAWLRFEPWSTSERLGTVALFLVALSAGLVAVGLARAIAVARATRRIRRRWDRNARPVDLPGATVPAFAVEDRFPVAAVLGFFRPRLVVSSALLARCSPAEMRAIVAHETGHLLRWDAWKALALRVCPDLLALTPLGREIERRFLEAAEHAADDHAAAGDRERSLDLASALLKVARLATASPPVGFPQAAFYRARGVAGRVERLLEPGPFRAEHPRAVPRLLLGAALLVTSLALLRVDLLARVHLVIEAAVRLLS